MAQTFITDVKFCTHCGKELKDIKILIKLNYQVQRKTEADTWEIVDNTDISSNEMLCKTCFDVFVDTIDKAMNHNEDSNV
jgi:hypothetical protein